MPYPDYTPTPGKEKRPPPLVAAVFPLSLVRPGQTWCQEMEPELNSVFDNDFFAVEAVGFGYHALGRHEQGQQ